MIVRDRREFAIGVALVAVFVAALALVFRPTGEGGQNVLDYLDGVFNSTSKASAYYIPAARERVRKLGATPVSTTIAAKENRRASEAEALFRSAGASVAVEANRLSISGDLGAVLAAALADADAMFRNDGAAVLRRHGIEGRRVLLAWHWALGETVKDLNRQQRFREAAAVRDVLTKGLEPAYNYYGVTAVAMKDMIWVALAALLGYVLYTVWYGFAILYLFEGWGLKLEH
jgi:hypothetical protein